MLIGLSHAHSTHSFDGRLDLEHLQQFLTDRGRDFCLMSEHIEGMDGPAIQRMLDHYAALPGDRCLMIPGIEIDDLNILIYGIRRAHEFTNVADLAARYHADGALFAVSHPVKIRGSVPRVVVPWISAVEVWNTRHDGTRNPRAGNVALWRELGRENPRLVPLFAVDFHSTSDFSSAAIGVDAPRDRDAILDAIASGRHVLLRERTPLPIEPASAVGRLASRLSTRTFDAALRVNKALSRLRLKPPAAVRRVLKRAL